MKVAAELDRDLLLLGERFEPVDEERLIGFLNRPSDDFVDSGALFVFAVRSEIDQRETRFYERTEGAVILPRELLVERLQAARVACINEFGAELLDRFAAFPIFSSNRGRLPAFRLGNRFPGRFEEFVRGFV